MYKEPLFSVIIPVYNAEEWITQCVNSISTQSFTSWELICVNDGSVDSSGKILDELAQADFRIKVIHTPNSGVSAARNNGIRNATGKYIIFLDSDDFLIPNALKILNDCIATHHPELIHFRQTNFIQNHNYGIESIPSTNHTQHCERIDEGGLSACSWFAWDKVYKLDILQKHKLFFNEDMTLCEDFHFWFRYAMHCKEICYTNAGIYIKRPSPGGLYYTFIKKWEAQPEKAKTNIRLLWDLSSICDQISNPKQRKACRIFLLDRSPHFHFFIKYKLLLIPRTPLRRVFFKELRYPFKRLTQEISIYQITCFVCSCISLIAKKSIKKLF